MSGQKSEITAPTVEQINFDRITQLANEYWAPNSTATRKNFSPRVLEDVYLGEIVATSFAIRKIMLLEFSRFLENYLWPNYNPRISSHAHVMSIAIMVNEKFRERIPAWEAFKKAPEHFPAFFQSVLHKALEDEKSVSWREQTALLIFLIHAFNSVEEDLIRIQVQRLVSLPMWMCLVPSRREREFRLTPKLRKFWNVLQKKDAQVDEETKKTLNSERSFLWSLIKKFLNLLETIPATGKVAKEKVHYCERFLELLIDLEALLPTRRFFNTVLSDSHVVVKCNLSHLTQREDGKLFNQLLDMLKFYSRFEINDHLGEALADHEMTDIHYSRITALQRTTFKHFPELNRFSLNNVASVDTRNALAQHFGSLSGPKLHELAAYLNLLPSPDEENSDNYSKDLLLEILISLHERRSSQLESLNEMPLYPTEEVIWDENIVPTEYFSGEGCLALPKLNLQFLTLHDYLLRNFNLFRLESTYEIRQDIRDAMLRLKPWKREDSGVYFGGWARMAQPIVNFSVVEVAKPNIGEKQPSRVRADVSVTLNLRKEIKSEWEALRKHDVCFLITLKPQLPIGTPLNRREPLVPQVGITYVRGCEVEGMLDISGRVIEEGPDPRPHIPGDTRTFRVWLDCNQYRVDMDNTTKGQEDVYETFNVLLRRKPKENNFKAVLETIRDLMNTDCVVPDWLHNIILGYGDPGAAHYSRMPNQVATLDFHDTFLSADHLKSCFPDHEIRFKTEDPLKLVPPFRLKFRDVDAAKNPESTEVENKTIDVEPYIPPSRGPYPFEQPKKNAVPFTATQVEAIKAGMQPGLTMVVGPPGTGKTDVAVQIISNIYHNFPEQRTLIVTHSNQALNQLFEKIMSLDVDERHLLRLGHGEEALETEKDFSRYGRVNYVLAKRLELLQEVHRLQQSLDVPGDVSYTCETAGHFYLYQVLARWEVFMGTIKSNNENLQVEHIRDNFPFSKFFANAPQPLFKQSRYEEDLAIAEGCFRYIRKIFAQLDEFRAFELLRSGLDRSRYLLVKEAKIIAMTCTHAALKRRELVELGFKYDNILMEESAQILEIETFIPLLLQKPEDGFSRLKRWIMIGDHHQLPPVIKNMAFQKYSNMEQSLFTRFVRLGVPTVDLDAQGRARPSICTLYNWRYRKLGNLDHVLRWSEYTNSNPGFCFDYQLIDVQDFNGIGESEPNPYFYQNLAEAEYVVAVFMYMRLIGYPSEKISILTTYNGQKHLIRDVINERCANNPLIGRPYKVTTVDKYQGQQNDYILLSLVRTRAVGHLRDVRRLVVAMSRARLGLYVFARVKLFQNCYELTPSFNLLMERPLELHMCPSETYACRRKTSEPPEGELYIMKDMPQMVNFVFEFYKYKVETAQTHMKVLKPFIEPPKRRRKRPAMDNSLVDVHPGASDSDDDDDSDSDDEDDSEKPEVVPPEEEEKVTEAKKDDDAVSEEDEPDEDQIPEKIRKIDQIDETEDKVESEESKPVGQDVADAVAATAAEEKMETNSEVAGSEITESSPTADEVQPPDVSSQ